jgi:predicted ribosomally synthesized peptide with SipW-like signal peptide
MNDTNNRYTHTTLDHHSPRRRRRAYLSMVLVIGLLAMMAGLGTVAFFTSQAVSDNNTFVAGNLEIQVSDDASTADPDGPAHLISASITRTNAKPGDKAYGWIEVHNVGSLPLYYGLEYAATDSGTYVDDSGAIQNSALTQFLKLAVYTGVTKVNCAAGTVGAGTAIFGSSTMVASVTTDILDRDSAGVGNAQQKRALNNSTTEVLCFEIDFPDSTTAGTENAGKGGTSNITFTFNAKQQ